MRKRKNYPGDIREPGTKDYAVILGNLMGFRNQLLRSTEEQDIGDTLVKVAEKLKELGFKTQSESIKKKVGRRKLGHFQNITEGKKKSTIETINKVWDKAKDKHESAKSSKTIEQRASKTIP